MKQKTLILLTLITAVVVIAAVVMMKDPSADAGEQSTAFFPNLEERVNDVARIEINSAGTDVVIAKQGGDWVLETTGNYPAKFEVVKRVLIGLSELDRSEGKTSNPKLYSRLGVDAPSAGPQSSTEIELLDASGTRIAAVILGNIKEGQVPQLYARQPDEAQAWLVNGRVNIQMDPGFWIEKQFANLPQDRVASVVIERSDEPLLRVYKDRPSEANFRIADVPAGREPISESIANPVASGLNYLALEEVRPATEIAFAEPLVAKTTYRTWEGFVVRVETTRVQGENWIRLRAEAGERPTILPEPPAEGEEPAEPEPYQGLSAEELAAEIAGFNEALGPWAYRIAPYKLSSIEKRMEELLRDLPAPEPPPAETPADFDAFSIDDTPATTDQPTFGEIMSGESEGEEPSDG